MYLAKPFSLEHKVIKTITPPWRDTTLLYSQKSVKFHWHLAGTYICSLVERGSVGIQYLALKFYVMACLGGNIKILNLACILYKW